MKKTIINILQYSMYSYYYYKDVMPNWFKCGHDEMYAYLVFWDLLFLLTPVTNRM
jgi:hypothetical protein